MKFNTGMRKVNMFSYHWAYAGSEFKIWVLKSVIFGQMWIWYIKCCSKLCPFFFFTHANIFGFPYHYCAICYIVSHLVAECEWVSCEISPELLSTLYKAFEQAWHMSTGLMDSRSEILHSLHTVCSVSIHRSSLSVWCIEVCWQGNILGDYSEF